jgi:hypothetical protein
MASTTTQPEPRKSSAASEPRDPLVEARTLAYRFAALSGDFQARGGIRDRLYGILKDAYWLGSFFKEWPEAYRRFKNDEYWLDVRQKPNDRNIMRSVLAFTMRTKNQEALQNRACKYARVLEYLHQEELLPDEVPQRLKDGGGIDEVYAKLCRDPGAREGQGDSLEELIGAPPPVPTANVTDAETSDGGPGLAAERSLASGDSDDAFPLDDDGLQSNGRGPCDPISALCGANERTDTFSGEAQRARTTKLGPLNRIDLKTTLAVEMFECELEEVLHARRATIRVIVQPRDARGWVRVVTQSVMTSNSVEGPWPGVPARRDDDERH